jgi:DNA-binding IclR family transcriptional regulator
MVIKGVIAGSLEAVPGPIQSIERAAAILQLLADNPGQLGVSEIADSLDLAKTTTHGLLRTLRTVGYVEQTAVGGRYRLGDGLSQLRSEPLDPNELRSRALNWADSLASRTGESVRVASPKGDVAVVVHHVFRPDDSAQQLDIDLELPLHASAFGKILLAGKTAFGPRQEDELDRYTARTVTSRRTLARELVEIRRRGWAADIGEYIDGVAAVAAPIRNDVGRAVGAIGIVGSPARLCDPRGDARAALVEQVRVAARAVSRDLATARR